MEGYRKLRSDKNTDLCLKFTKYDDEIFLQEMLCDVPTDIQYSCASPGHMSLGEIIYETLCTAIEKKCAVSSMRWYPYYDIQAQMGTGPVYIVARACCKGKRIRLTLQFGYTHSNEHYYYTIKGHKKIEYFLYLFGYNEKLEK